jgi:hypothetical protein
MDILFWYVIQNYMYYLPPHLNLVRSIFNNEISHVRCSIIFFKKKRSASALWYDITLVHYDKVLVWFRSNTHPVKSCAHDALAVVCLDGNELAHPSANSHVSSFSPHAWAKLGWRKSSPNRWCVHMLVGLSWAKTKTYSPWLKISQTMISTCKHNIYL